MGCFATSAATRGHHGALWPVADGHIARLSYAFQIIGVCAFLSSCSEPALVTAQMTLHKAPTAQSEAVALVPKGSQVDASDCSNGWCWVKWNAKEGYALAKNLRTRSSRPAPAAEDRDDEADVGSQDSAGDGD
jgi:hypothetical protein